MKTYLVRGVPASIQQDGWWMDGVQRHRRIREPHRTVSKRWMVPALIAIAIIGVWLILQTDTCLQQYDRFGPTQARGSE